MCFGDVQEGDRYQDQFLCDCASGYLCVECYGRVQACPWCRAPKRATELHTVVQQSGVMHAMRVRQSFYMALRVVHGKLWAQQAEGLAAYVSWCEQVVLNDSKCFDPHEVACFRATRGGAARVLQGFAAEKETRRVYERTLATLLEFLPSCDRAGGARAAHCPSCRMVANLYGTVYLSVECSACVAVVDR